MSPNYLQHFTYIILRFCWLSLHCMFTSDEGIDLCVLDASLLAFFDLVNFLIRVKIFIFEKMITQVRILLWIYHNQLNLLKLMNFIAVLIIR